MTTSSKFIFKKISSELAFLQQAEAEAMTWWVMEEIYGLRRIDILADKNIEDTKELYLNEVLTRIKAHEPIQYIFGYTEFYGRKFMVNSHVLIPRPETEELVDMVVNEYKNFAKLKIIDFCTGSGCIAITLQLHLGDSEVFATDISARALDIARHNAHQLGAKVNFIESDVLADTSLSLKDIDIIVSNPPYVLHGEKKSMSKNVLDYEPALALFVPDDDPLKYYRSIVHNAASLLKSGGKCFLEINELYGAAIKEMLIDSNFREVAVLRDLNGKDRIVKGTVQHE